MAKVFWRPDLCADILPLTTAHQLPPLALPFKTTISSTTMRATDEYHVLFHEGPRRLQLFIRQGLRRDAGVLSTDAVIDKPDIAPRLRSLMCFNDLLSSGRLHARYFLAEPRGRRLTAVLRALDGALQTSSHREIAIVLHGRKRVDADWNSPGEHLRDTVRRAIVRGRALMNGAYRGLLR